MSLNSFALVLCLLGQAEPADIGLGNADAAQPAAGPLEPLRAEYRADAEKYEFTANADEKHPFALVEKPIMRWASDDDWSGDVFLWADKNSQPRIVGCMLSGPTKEGRRMAFHEFHLLSDRPIAPAKLQTGRTWQPAEGLTRIAVKDADPPAATTSGRLVQMRDISRQFSAWMEADGAWELRLLPQPLYRYGADSSGVMDGALFTWVWNKGTDPEVILLVECRKTGEGRQWYYAPVRFSNRGVWLKQGEREVWRAESHQEPADSNSLMYTTAYARTFALDAENAIRAEE
jgi:hypothetical protein